MTPYHAQDFKTRIHAMGDKAESVFDLVYPKHHKLGLNRPPFFMGRVPLNLRYTPDRMLEDRMVECMGIGRDRKLKMKVEKHDALLAWDRIAPVWLFVYDQVNGTYHEGPIADWWGQAAAHGTSGTFENDGKQYVALHASHFPFPAQKVPDGHLD